MEEVAGEEAETGGMEETLVGEDGNEDEDEDDNPDAAARTDEPPVDENEAVCERFADSHCPSGSRQSTLKELAGEPGMQEDNGASMAL